MNYLKKYFGLIVLNTQLIIGFSSFYSYLTRHIIVNNVFLYVVLVVIFSNLIFLGLKFIKFESIKSLLSIIISSVLLGLLFLKFSKSEAHFVPKDLVIIFLYLFVGLRLYITTPIAILIEVLLRRKWRNT